MLRNKRSYWTLCAVSVGILVLSVGCIKMTHQNWSPTEGLAGNTESQNFVVCKSCEDVNYDGKLGPEEIQDADPDWVKAGDEVNFVVRNTSSWSLKSQVELRNKETDEVIFRSPVQKLPADTTWTTSAKTPKFEKETELVAIFDVDFAPAHKTVFTVIP